MITKEDIVYLSGKMTGIPDWGHQSFLDAEELLKEKFGCIIHNPAKSFGSRKDLPRAVYMRHDIHMLLEATAVFFLNGWHESKGAHFEYSIAKELGLRIYYQSVL